MTNENLKKGAQENQKKQVEKQQLFNTNKVIEENFSSLQKGDQDKMKALVQTLLEKKLNSEKVLAIINKLKTSKDPVKKLENFIKEYIKKYTEIKDIQNNQPRITINLIKKRVTEAQQNKSEAQQNKKIMLN